MDSIVFIPPFISMNRSGKALFILYASVPEVRNFPVILRAEASQYSYAVVYYEMFYPGFRKIFKKCSISAYLSKTTLDKESGNILVPSIPILCFTVISFLVSPFMASAISATISGYAIREALIWFPETRSDDALYALWTATYINATLIWQCHHSFH